MIVIMKVNYASAGWSVLQRHWTVLLFVVCNII